MLKADLSNEAATEFLHAALLILDKLGEDTPAGSSDLIAYHEGNLVFARTNTGHIEVRYKGETGFSYPTLNPEERTVWLPGDWVNEVDRIYQRTSQQT